MSTEEVAGRRLTFAQRRKMGLTLGNCLRVARRLKQDGRLSDDEDVAAGQIAAELAGENTAAFNEAGVDWDSILAFIEKLLPLILQLLAIFGM